MQTEMNPIKADVVAWFGSAMRAVGWEDQQLSRCQMMLLAAILQKDLAGGDVYDLIGAFGSFGVDPFAPSLKQTCVYEFHVWILQNTHIGFSYLMSHFGN